MKIDQNRANLETIAGARADAVRDERAAAAEKAAPDDRSSDQVRVSTTGQLAAAAAAKANEASDIRPDAVARGRDLLERGELGRDAARLADRLIDSLLDKG
jgi:flagellar biosynthesis anti-sigma factor FlgM